MIITRKEGKKGEFKLPAAVAEVDKVTRAKAPSLAPAVRVGVLAVGIEADLGGRSGGGVGGGRRHPQSYGIRYDNYPQGKGRSSPERGWPVETLNASTPPRRRRGQGEVEGEPVIQTQQTSMYSTARLLAVY